MSFMHNTLLFMGRNVCWSREVREIPIYLLQQAEHITESEVDIEKKKQELYSEIDALGIKSDSRINKLKKFLAD